MKRTKDRHGLNAFPDWTVEEFDAIEENHVFSERYQTAKCRAIASCKETSRVSPLRISFRAAAVALAVCFTLSVGAYAAVTHADFFRHVFGADGRQSVQAHEETIEDGKGGEVSVIYPAREYVDADVQRAEELLGNCVLTAPVVTTINDHMLTILSAVRDCYAMAMEFTLECETGVTALKYDQTSNEAKGAYFAAERTFDFRVDNAADTIYVDMDKSTDTKLHGYYYCVFLKPLGEQAFPMLNIAYADGPFMALPEGVGPKERQEEIPIREAVRTIAFASDSGAALELSPIGMKVDLAKGLGLTEAEAYDPGNLDAISVEFEDGTTYLVRDAAGNVDNTAYLCGGLDGTCVSLVFNRLIDPAQVASVSVNGVVCAPQ